MAKKNYVIDTSVFLTDSSCLFKFGNNDLFIAHKVLEEIDKHKKRQDSVGFHARHTIKVLDELREKGSLSKGLRLGKGMGILKVEEASRPLPGSLSMRVPDHQILGVALAVQEAYPKRKTVVLSRDINMRVIADSVGMLTQDYNSSQVVENTDKIYSGQASILVDDELIDQFYAGEDIYLPHELVAAQNTKLYPNMFVMLVSSSSEKKTALCKFNSHNNPVERLVDFKNELQWGVHPRNKEQKFAFNLLMDPDIHLVTLIGQAGSGKTLCAIAAGMEQSVSFGTMFSKKSSNMFDKIKYDLDQSSHHEEDLYRKLVVSRPIQPMGRDIGFLPGSMEEKMLPWLKPIQDNIQFIMGNDKTMLQNMMESGSIELEALTYIRGRSISNAFIIVDEAQNLTALEVKTIITRAGEGTKIVLTGDIEQIDNVYTNETSNGLTYAIEKFKHSPLAGHVSFKKGERSKLATAAAKIL